MITLEQLIIHMPYKPQCHAMGEHIVESENTDNPIPKLFTITGFFPDLNGEAIIQMDYEGDVYNAHIDDIFLIAHPLSDLTKPVKVKGYNDGKEFVPIVELANWLMEQEPESFDNLTSARVWLDIHIRDTQNLPFKIVIWLAENHYWIYDQSLFKAGEIIDINTLK